jgi:hypothetical protein
MHIDILRTEALWEEQVGRRRSIGKITEISESVLITGVRRGGELVQMRVQNIKFIEHSDSKIVGLISRLH